MRCQFVKFCDDEWDQELRKCLLIFLWKLTFSDTILQFGNCNGGNTDVAHLMFLKTLHQYR